MAYDVGADVEFQEHLKKYPNAVWVSQREYSRIFNALSIRQEVQSADISGGWEAMHLPDGRLVLIDLRQEDSHVMDEYVESLEVSPELWKIINSIQGKARELVDIFLEAVPRGEDNREARVALSKAAGMMTRVVANL